MGRILGWLFFCAVLVAGCGPKPQANGCTGIYNGLEPVSPQMLYPINGATAVPDGNFTLVMSSYASTLTLYLHGKGTSIGPLSPTAVPSPLPSPYASPLQSATSAYSVGALASGTTYTLSGPPIPPSECQPNDTIGSFTTR